MQSDGEEACLKPVRDYTVLHIAVFYAVDMEFLSQLFSVSCTYAYTMLSDCVFSAPVVSSGQAVGAGGTAG